MLFGRLALQHRTATTQQSTQYSPFCSATANQCVGSSSTAVFLGPLSLSTGERVGRGYPQTFSHFVGRYQPAVEKGDPPILPNLPPPFSPLVNAPATTPKTSGGVNSTFFGRWKWRKANLFPTPHLLSCSLCLPPYLLPGFPPPSMTIPFSVLRLPCSLPSSTIIPFSVPHFFR